jgi:uncharacterized protein (TIGR00369 family)
MQALTNQAGLNPFLQHLGVQIIQAQEGRATVLLTLAERHMNSWQMTHGGVLMSLLDVAMAMAGRSLPAEPKGVVTVEMKTTFLQAAGVPGDQLEARGIAYHQSATMCFCEGEIWLAGKLVAKASGTFKYLRRLLGSTDLKSAD